jgi:hypothetical protein
MSVHQDIHSLWQYPAITARQHRALWIMLQGGVIVIFPEIVILFREETQKVISEALKIPRAPAIRIS